LKVVEEGLALRGGGAFLKGKLLYATWESAFSVPSLSAREKQRETTFSFAAWIPGATDFLDHQILRCICKLQVIIRFKSSREIVAFGH
jgi:hypothetical protein